MTTNPGDAPAIRWGILAPGRIARRFAREVTAYTAGRVVAVGSRDLGRAQSFVADHLSGAAKAYGSYEELVADEGVDAVYVASPHSEHRDHAILALEAGKPVLVEKSFTLNAGQAEEVFAVAKRQGLFAMEAMWSHCLPHYPVMRDLIAAGELGEVQAIIGVHAQALNLAVDGRLMNRSLAGGALLDLGIYPLSLIHWLWGVPDRIVAAGVLTGTGVDLRENVSCLYGDRVGVAYADMGVAAGCSLQVVGTKGRITIPDMFYTPNDLVLTSADGTSRVIPTKVEGGFQYQAAEAARCIAAGLLESPAITWNDTVEVMRMADEVRRQLGVRFTQEEAGS